MASANPLHTTDSTTVKGTESTSSTSKASKNLFNAVYGSILPSAKAETPPPPTTSSDSTVAAIASTIGQAGLAANNAIQAQQEAQIKAAEAAKPSTPEVANAVLPKPITPPEATGAVPLVTDTTAPVSTIAKPEIISTPGNTKTEINGSSKTVTDNSGRSVTVSDKGLVVNDPRKGVVVDKPSGEITVQGTKLTYNPTTSPKEISYNQNGVHVIEAAETLQQFEASHKQLAPDTVVKLTNGDQIAVNANGVERIITPTQVIFKLPNGGNTYTFENSPNGLMVQTNNGGFVNVNDTSLAGIISQNSDGSYHLAGSGNDIGANLGHVTDTTMTGANGEPLKAVIGANGEITTNADNPPVNIHYDQSTGTFQILSTTGADLVNIDTTTGAIYNSDFNLSASGNVSLWNGEMILANGTIQDSNGNTIYDNNNDTTDSTSFNNNPNFNNTATLDSSVGGIVNNIEGKVSAGDVSPSDISHLELCLGALDNAMNRAQAIGNVALISELSSCQATIGNVLGQAQASLKTNNTVNNSDNFGNANLTKPRNDFNHYDIIAQHSNHNFSSTAKLLYA